VVAKVKETPTDNNTDKIGVPIVGDEALAVNCMAPQWRALGAGDDLQAVDFVLHQFLV
jgi:hypothetical protein